ncbi:MAG: hypothetical protein HY763_13090 [Planctomycetes bacterium]|nr:hypothetical protein [Planctomycetota bacterium]
MSRTREFGVVSVAVLFGVLGLALLLSPGFSALLKGDAPAAVAAADEAGECLTSDAAAAEASGAASAAKPCRPCKDRPWCECTYQGAHRISCDPCCYQDYAGQITCFD